MVRKYLLVVLKAFIVVLSVAGLIMFFKEYAKSYLRDSVKQDILRRSNTDDVVYEVPAGDYLAVEGEENMEEISPAEGIIEIAGYCAGNGNETEKLHLLGIISIPSLGIEEPIWEENSSLAMRYGVILLKGYAGLGQEGNSIIVGHRNTVTHTIFDKLTKIKNNDIVILTTPDGIDHKYRVNGTYYCSPYDLEDYVGTSEEYPVMITLITCAREKGNCWRFIATLIPSED